jgi:hypothetical protein
MLASYEWDGQDQIRITECVDFQLAPLNRTFLLIKWYSIN